MVIIVKPAIKKKREDVIPRPDIVPTPPNIGKIEPGPDMTELANRLATAGVAPKQGASMGGVLSEQVRQAQPSTGEQDVQAHRETLAQADVLQKQQEALALEQSNALRTAAFENAKLRNPTDTWGEAYNKELDRFKQEGLLPVAGIAASIFDYVRTIFTGKKPIKEQEIEATLSKATDVLKESTKLVASGKMDYIDARGGLISARNALKRLEAQQKVTSFRSLTTEEIDMQTQLKLQSEALDILETQLNEALLTQSRTAFGVAQKTPTQ